MKVNRREAGTYEQYYHYDIDLEKFFEWFAEEGCYKEEYPNPKDLEKALMAALLDYCEDEDVAPDDYFPYMATESDIMINENEVINNLLKYYEQVQCKSRN